MYGLTHKIVGLAPPCNLEMLKVITRNFVRLRCYLFMYRPSIGSKRFEDNVQTNVGALHAVEDHRCRARH